MALVPCRECGRQVSTEARTCPHCGVPDPAKAELEAREQAERERLEAEARAQQERREAEELAERERREASELEELSRLGQLLEDAVPGSGEWARFIKENLEAGRTAENIAKDLARRGIANLHAHDLIRIVKAEIRLEEPSLTPKTTGIDVLIRAVANKRPLWIILGLLLVAWLWRGTEPGQRELAPSGARGNGVQVTRSQYGDAWPFTVDQGVVYCVGPGAAVFVTGGTEYAVNGTAIAMGRFAGLRPIWRDDPNDPPDLGLKVNIGPMIDLALEQCGL